MRMGGICEDNLFMRDPHAVIFGSNQNPAPYNITGIIRNNVILNSRDIGKAQPQGSGILLQSYNMTDHSADPTNPHNSSFIVGVSVYNNIIAHNARGTFNIKAISVGSDAFMQDVDVHNNIVYNWSRNLSSANDHRSTMLLIGITPNSTLKNVSIQNNIFQQPHGGFVASSGKANSYDLILKNNTYYTPEIDSSSVWSKGWFELGGAVNSSSWIKQMNEQDIKLKKVEFKDPTRSIETYMSSLGMTPTYEAFMEHARNQSRLNWDDRFTAYSVNDYIREGFQITGYEDSLKDIFREFLEYLKGNIQIEKLSPQLTDWYQK
jgi:hypothetical protein